MNPARSAICRYLEWDSDFFGRRIARLTPESFTARGLSAAVRWCNEQSIDCLYALINLDHLRSLHLCESQSFHFVDLRVTLDQHLERKAIRAGRPRAGRIRPARPDDLPALKAIAGTIHRDSRFFQDVRFSRSRCRRLYEVWIEKSCMGDADVVLVPEWKGRPVGYSACVLQRRGKGQLSLFGIAPSAQRRGLGGQLLAESLNWFEAHGVSQVSVVTQGRNIPSQRLYQRYGFRTSSVQGWYHRWFLR